MPQETIPILQLLYCYVPEDRHWLEKIDHHFSNLKRQCQIMSQFDGELLMEAGYQERLLTRLTESDVILLLVSTHFKKRADLWNKLSQESWKVRWLGGCRVIVLLLESIDWNDTPFETREVLPRITSIPINWQNPEPVAPLKVFPEDVKPLEDWPDQGKAFLALEQGMRAAIEKQWLARGNYERDEGGGGVHDQRALSAYSEALRLNPAISSAWYGKAHVLVGLQRYQEALKACDEASQLAPTFPWPWFVKGIALARLDREEEALGAYHEAFRLEPMNMHFRQRYLETLKALGRDFEPQ